MYASETGTLLGRLAPHVAAQQTQQPQQQHVQQALPTLDAVLAAPLPFRSALAIAAAQQQQQQQQPVGVLHRIEPLDAALSGLAAHLVWATDGLVYKLKACAYACVLMR